MKQFIYTIIVILTVNITFISCEENEVPIFDTQGGRAIAGFNTGDPQPNIIFNPTANTSNSISLGVSTITGSSRNVVVTVDEMATTLDPSFFEITTLTPTIQAGDFNTAIEITTIGNPVLPGMNDVIVLNLESIDGAEILEDSKSRITIGLNIQCSTVEEDNIVGTYQIIADTRGFALTSTLEIIAGSAPGKYIMVNPLGHPNPNDGGAQSYDVEIEIDLNSGVTRMPRQDAWHCDNIGCAFGQGRIDGAGLTLTCIDRIQFLALNYTVDAGSFGPFVFIIEKI